MKFDSFRRVPDIQPNNFPQVNWATKPVEALGELRAYVAAEIKQAAEWYLRKRSLKRRTGQAVRLGSTVLATVAGVLPVLATILVTDGKSSFNAAWASILLGVARPAAGGGG